MKIHLGTLLLAFVVFINLGDGSDEPGRGKAPMERLRTRETSDWTPMQEQISGYASPSYTNQRADPKSFPNVPPNSITVDMSDGTRYGITLRRLHNFFWPHWVLDLSTPVDHYAHVHLTDEDHYDTPAPLNFINYNRFNDHNPYTHAPEKAYLRLGEDRYYTARGFKNFYFKMPEYDYDNNIIVSMPGGPLFIASLVKRQDKPVCIIDAALLARYNIRMTPEESSAVLQMFQPKKKSGILSYFSSSRNH